MYYLVKVKIDRVIDTKKGESQTKPFNEDYLVEAVSVSDAETKVYQYLDGTESFEVTSSAKTKILEVIG